MQRGATQRNAKVRSQGQEKRKNGNGEKVLSRWSNFSPPQSINQAINQASKRAKALGRGSASYA